MFHGAFLSSYMRFNFNIGTVAKEDASILFCRFYGEVHKMMVLITQNLSSLFSVEYNEKSNKHEMTLILWMILTYFVK